MNHIGIDPGASGGIAILSGDDAQAWKMPDTERDLCELVFSLRYWADHQARAVIEVVHSSPQMGVKSAFSFGSSYGGLRMALIASGIPFQEVRPQRWQKDMGCLTGGDKNVSKAKAQQLFPQIKCTHAIADSLLLAEWLRRQP